MELKECFDNLRQRSPLIHCITNYVTAQKVADILLAIGASPVMADCREEVEDIEKISDGLVMNLGTLNRKRVLAMILAGKAANSRGLPVVLDPVGVGVSSYRKDTAIKLLDQLQIRAVRGNMSEIRALAAVKTGQNISEKGVDANPSDAVSDENLAESVAFVKNFSKEAGVIVSATGKIDLISDGECTLVIRNGNPMMKRVTGAGCELSALIAAALAANPEAPLWSVAMAAALMGISGEMAYKKLLSTEGSASFGRRMVDAASLMTGEELEKAARVEMF